MFVLAHAPIPYTEFRLPVFDLRWATRQRYLPLLFINQVISQLTYAMRLGVLEVRSLSENPWYMYGLLAAVQFLVCVCCGLLAWGMPTSAIVLVRAFACFSLPTVILQAFALMEANGAAELMGEYVDKILVWCYALDALASFATGASVATTAGTRWRFVSFICAQGVVGNLARAASTVLLNMASGGTWSPDEEFASGATERVLARRIFDWAYVPCLLQVIVMVVASAYLEREATGQLWTWRQRRLVQRAVKGSSPSISAEVRYVDATHGAVETVVDEEDEYRNCCGFKCKLGVGRGSGWGYEGKLREGTSSESEDGYHQSSGSEM
jgi:hypothetical protein